MDFKLEDVKVINDEAVSRFEASVGGQVAYLSYERRGARIVYDHTKVPPALEGHGLAGKLTRTALDDARAQGLKVVPVCSYVASYIGKHPEYQDLVAPPQS
jgi:predicted GNAT family acetyltransferase